MQGNCDLKGVRKQHSFDAQGDVFGARRRMQYLDGFHNDLKCEAFQMKDASPNRVSCSKIGKCAHNSPQLQYVWPKLDSEEWSSKACARAISEQFREKEDWNGI